MWWEELRGSERGELSARRFEVAARARRAASLELSNCKEFATPHHGAVNSLQVDLTEGRYLLSGASDGSVAVFDVWNPTEYEAGFIAKHRNILLADKQHENGHRFAVSAAIWYPRRPTINTSKPGIPIPLRSSWTSRCPEKCTLQSCLQLQQRICSSILGVQMFRSVCVTLLLEPLPTRYPVIAMVSCLWSGLLQVDSDEGWLRWNDTFLGH